MRGRVKEVEALENVDFAGIWFKLADFGIQFEWELDYLRSQLLVCTTSTDRSNAPVVLDQILRHFDPEMKNQFEELVDQYNRNIANDQQRDIVIRTDTSKTMMGKQSGRSGLIPKSRS